MVLMIGHSHMHLLPEAAAKHGVELNCLYLWLSGPAIIRGDGAPRINPLIADRLEPDVVALIGGGAPDLFGLVQHPVPFDFILPDRPDLPLIAGAEIIPYRAVINAMAAFIGPDEIELAGMIAATGSRVRQIESPPPFADTERLADEVGIMTAMWKRAPEQGSAPSPPWLRYKIWRTHSALVRQRCEAQGVEFVPVPRDALVDGAFLAPELYAYPCHANEAYGALVLRQLGILPERHDPIRDDQQGAIGAPSLS